MERNLSAIDRVTLSLSFNDFQRFSQLMQDRFGLAFSEKRRTELEIGVRRAFAASTCQDLESYYRMLLNSTHGEMELERLVNYLTIGETHFFRDAGQFNALVNTVLPELIERRRASRTLRIWSAGCASGEEPFSIAMLLRNMLPDIEDWNILILGTDVNTQHLERARRAVYSDWAFREARSKMLRPQFFTQHGNQYQLNSVIQRMVQFEHLNLSDNHYPSYETNTMLMDLILCRNVTIYFPEKVTHQVVNKFYNALTEGGWLVIGHSEHSLDTYRKFRLHNFQDAILYQRTADTEASTPAAPQRSTFQPSPSILFQYTKPESEANRVDSIPPAVAVSTQIKTDSAGIKEHQKPSDPPPVVADTFEQAQSLMSFGHVDQARDILLRWLAKHPTHAAGCALLGTAYANLGNGPEAERWCKLAIAHDRLCLDAYYTLALVFQHQGKPEPAIEMMKKVVYIDRNDILGHFNLAELFHSSGQHGLALKFLENTRRLLEGRPIDALVPRSGDITVGRLAQTIIELVQTWGEIPEKTISI
jgi:chemotaxis protein methyltransferase CheR